MYHLQSQHDMSKLFSVYISGGNAPGRLFTMNLDLICGLRKHIRVGSHVPGKLTLKIGLSVIVDPGVVEYVKVNGFGPPKDLNMPGVKRTRFNPLTRSMTMDYDKEIIEPKLLHKLFVCENDQEFEAVAERLANACHVDLTTFCQ